MTDMPVRAREASLRRAVNPRATIARRVRTVLTALVLLAPLLAATRTAEASVPESTGTGQASCPWATGGYVFFEGTFVAGGELWYAQGEAFVHGNQSPDIYWSGSMPVEWMSIQLSRDPRLITHDPLPIPVAVEREVRGGDDNDIRGEIFGVAQSNQQMSLAFEGVMHDTTNGSVQPLAFSMEIVNCGFPTSYTQREGTDRRLDPEDGSGVVPVAMAATSSDELFVSWLSLDGTFLFDGERYGLDTTIPGCNPCLRGPVLETSEVTSTEDLRETCGDDCGWLVEDVENNGLHRFGIHNSGILTEVDLEGSLVNPDTGAPVGSVALEGYDATGVGNWTSVQSHDREEMGTWSTAAWRATFTVDARVCLETCRTAPVTLSIRAGQVPQGAAALLPHSVGAYTQYEAAS